MNNMQGECLINFAIEVIKDGDLNKLKNIAKEIPEDKVSTVLSLWNYNGETALNVAIRKRDTVCTKFLLEDCKVDPMENDKDDWQSPLFIAVSNNDLDTVEMLIESGANPNLFDDEYYYLSPLTKACSEGHEAIARFLIEKGTDVDKSKCLTYAIENCTNIEFIKYLLYHAAEVNIKYEKWEDTPLHACCKKGDFEIFKLLVEKGAVNCADCTGQTPLQMAVSLGHEDIFSYYSENNVHTRDEILDCLELQGVNYLLRKHLTSALEIWNKVLLERPQFTNSSLLGIFQLNTVQIKIYEYDIEKYDHAAIHSLLILERIFGIDHFVFRKYFKNLLELVSITNIEGWKAIINFSFEPSTSLIADECIDIFNRKFESYARSVNYKNINSYVVNLAFMLLFVHFNTTFHKHVWKIMNRSEVFDIIKHVCAIKINTSDFDPDSLQAITGFLKCVPKDSILHTLIGGNVFPAEPHRIVCLTFELCCKIMDSVNVLNCHNNTPLHSALFNGNEKFIKILLSFGALPETRNLHRVSVRDLAIRKGRQDICLGYAPLQTMIHTKVERNIKVRFQRHLPLILRYFMIFH